MAVPILSPSFLHTYLVIELELTFPAVFSIFQNSHYQFRNLRKREKFWNQLCLEINRINRLYQLELDVAGTCAPSFDWTTQEWLFWGFRCSFLQFEMIFSWSSTKGAIVRHKLTDSPLCSDNHCTELRWLSYLDSIKGIVLLTQLEEGGLFKVVKEAKEFNLVYCDTNQPFAILPRQICCGSPSLYYLQRPKHIQKNDFTFDGEVVLPKTTVARRLFLEFCRDPVDVASIASIKSCLMDYTDPQFHFNLMSIQSCVDFLRKLAVDSNENLSSEN